MLFCIIRKDAKKRGSNLSRLATFVFLLFAISPSLAAESQNSPPAKKRSKNQMAAYRVSSISLLPEDNEVPGLVRKGEYVLYAGGYEESIGETLSGECLYDHIDAEATIYAEYGVHNIVFQRYKLKSGPTLIDLEIAEMYDPAAAFGIYHFRKARGGKVCSVAAPEATNNRPFPHFSEATTTARLYGAYSLQMWKHRFYVEINILGSNNDELSRGEPLGSPEGGDGTPPLLEIGRNIAAKIPTSQAEPEITRLIPEDGYIEDSLKYFRGPQALMHFCFISLEDILRLKYGAEGVYSEHQIGKDKLKLIIIKYSTKDDATAAQKSYLKFLNQKDARFYRRGFTELLGSPEITGPYGPLQNMLNGGHSAAILYKNYLIISGGRSEKVRSLAVTAFKKVLKE